MQYSCGAARAQDGRELYRLAKANEEQEKRERTTGQAIREWGWCSWATYQQEEFFFQTGDSSHAMHFGLEPITWSMFAANQDVRVTSHVRVMCFTFSPFWLDDSIFACRSLSHINNSQIPPRRFICKLIYIHLHSCQCAGKWVMWSPERFAEYLRHLTASGVNMNKSARNRQWILCNAQFDVTNKTATTFPPFTTKFCSV